MTKIKIKIKSKNGVIQSRYINNENLILYRKVKDYYIKKKITKKYKVVKIKSKNGVVQRRKLLITTLKKKYQYNRKEKAYIKKGKEKKKKVVKNCGYNYETLHHKGYRFINKVKIYIDDELTIKEHKSNLNLILNIVNAVLRRVKCPKRQYYVKLEYELYLGHEADNFELSALSTHITLNRDRLDTEIRQLYKKLLKIVSVPNSVIYIIIRKVITVNYDFKSNF